MQNDEEALKRLGSASEKSKEKASSRPAKAEEEKSREQESEEEEGKGGNDRAPKDDIGQSQEMNSQVDLKAEIPSDLLLGRGDFPRGGRAVGRLIVRHGKAYGDG